MLLHTLDPGHKYNNDNGTYRPKDNNEPQILYRLQDNNGAQDNYGAQDKNRTQDNNRTLDKLQGTCLSGHLQEHQQFFANLSFKLSHSPALGLP